MANGNAIASELLAKGTEEGRAFAAVQATYNTYAAIAAQLKAASAAGVIGPLAIATAVSTGVFGFLQVKKILNTRSPQTSGGGSGGGSTPNINQQDQNPLPNLDFGAVNQGVGGTQNGAFRSYVVNRDLENERKLEARLNDLAKVT